MHRLCKADAAGNWFRLRKYRAVGDAAGDVVLMEVFMFLAVCRLRDPRLILCAPCSHSRHVLHGVDVETIEITLEDGMA